MLIFSCVACVLLFPFYCISWKS